MCTVSVIHDYAKRWVPNETNPPLGNFQLPNIFDQEALVLLRRILALCEKLDAKMGEPDCIDPEKAKVLRALEEYVASKSTP